MTENFGVAWIHLDISLKEAPKASTILGRASNISSSGMLRRNAPRRCRSNRLGGTGSKAVDAELFITLVPTFFVCQGFGYA
jgi:hypothetical protein